MTTTLMQTDDNNNPVPALGYTLAHKVSGAAGAHVEVTLATTTKFFSIKTNAEICAAFGNNAVVATAASHGFFAGENEVIPCFDGMKNAQKFTTVSIYFVAAGTVYISERG